MDKYRLRQEGLLLRGLFGSRFLSHGDIGDVYWTRLRRSRVGSDKPGSFVFPHPTCANHLECLIAHANHIGSGPSSKKSRSIASCFSHRVSPTSIPRPDKMVKRSKLLQALDAHKGRDYDAEKQKKQVKAAEKRKGVKKGPAVEEAAKPVEYDEEVVSSEAEEEQKEQKEQEDDEAVDEEDEDEEVDEDEEDIPLSDLEDDEREDVVPHQRLTINNSAAITSSLKRISFITPQTPFSEHNSLVSQEPIEVEDPNDDLNRELAFYKVCQAAAISARGLLKKEGISFTRPGDYFAEMVKNDEHMDKIKKKLYDEAAGKKAAAEARRQRDLKKFGKQVQVAKLQQRAKEKRETLDKITALKKSTLTSRIDLFSDKLANVFYRAQG